MQQTFSTAILARLGLDPNIPEQAQVHGQAMQFSQSQRATPPEHSAQVDQRTKRLADKDGKIQELRNFQKRSEQAELNKSAAVE